MLNEPHFTLHKKLLPLSYLYGLGVYIRNKLYDWELIESHKYDIPIICVGNITVGGTGKTPHIEYLIRLLSKQYNIAVLSRGYKRKTKGFVLAQDSSTAKEIGDEPAQIKRKFPQITVAVDSDRNRGISQLQAHDKTIDVILLDDAFQHRKVKPSFSVLLTDYNRPIYKDRLLPAGRMRESFRGRLRADVIIVTKCPTEIQPMDFRIITKDLNLFAYQDVYFSYTEYGEMIPVFPNRVEQPLKTENIEKDTSILLLTGIASPKQLINYLSEKSNHISTLTFGDHHNFSKKDMVKLEEKWDNLSDDTLIITTEKDAARLYDNKYINEELKKHIYYIPIEIKFFNQYDQLFNNKIKEHVKQNRLNRRIFKKTNKE